MRSGAACHRRATARREPHVHRQTPIAAPRKTVSTMEANESIDWPLGAHLVSPRRGYLHHGIYAGSGRVIHYAGFNRAFRRGPVEEVALAKFTGGRSVQVLPRPTPRFSGDSVVARARERLGENRYRVWSNNCEHFVEWCLSGTS